MAKKVRLIEANALKGAMDRAAATQPRPYYPNMAISCVDKAPTVDAIPMWWITEKFLDVLNRDKELSRAAWMVRKAWLDEQGEDDGDS